MTFFLAPREPPNQATLAASASGGSVVGELVVVLIDVHPVFGDGLRWRPSGVLARLTPDS